MTDCLYYLAALSQTDDDDDNVGVIVGSVFGAIGIVILVVIAFKVYQSGM